MSTIWDPSSWPAPRWVWLLLLVWLTGLAIGFAIAWVAVKAATDGLNLPQGSIAPATVPALFGLDPAPRP